MGKVRKFFKIIGLISTVAAIISAIYGAFTVTAKIVEAGIKDPDDIYEYLDSKMGNTSYKASSQNIVPGNVDSLLEACEVIAKYMHDNKFTYTLNPNKLTNKFNEFGENGGCCCATYVSWCLQYARYIDDSKHCDNVCASHSDQNYKSDSVPEDGIWKVLDDNPHWKRLVAEDESDLMPGDVIIYKTGKSHTNIYAGGGQYWDAGESGTGAFIGQTKTRGGLDGYTCSYRYQD